MGYTHLGLLEYWWISYIRAVHYVCGTPFQISGNVSDIRNFFTRLGLAVLQKHSMMTAGWFPLHVFARWLCPMCVMGTWISSWDDVILIWYHYVVICTLVTILNWWFSSKDLKLQVMIKEALVVIHRLTVRIILLCSLSSGDGALFWYNRQLKNYYYICISDPRHTECSPGYHHNDFVATHATCCHWEI